MVWNQLRMYLQKSTPILAIDMHIFEIIILKKSTIGIANVRSVYKFLPVFVANEKANPRFLNCSGYLKCNAC